MSQGKLFEGFWEPNLKRHRAKRELPDQPLEPLLPGWEYVRNSHGVLPFAHLIKSRSSNGSVTTRCHKTGQPLPVDGVVVMLRCPECDMDLQLD